ncbi:MAG: zf-HC2 domain-containing protein [Ignavibacteriaceae bacterium]
MECIKNKEMIQLYIDGELGKDQESFVFTHLAECEECRLFFRATKLISSNIERKEFPNELEAHIFNSIGEKESRKKNLLFRKISYSFAYATTLLLLAASIFLYSKIGEYKNEVENINSQVKYQAQTIELLYNSLPAQVVHAKYSNEVIVKAKL